MVKDIIKDTIFLQMKSCDATIEDLSIGTDLIDTLLFNKRTCVGLAANMIGYNKKILVYLDKNNMPNVMYNPEIIMSEKEYKTEEGCLSLIGKDLV
jgi:peptide deformylase